MIIKSITDNLIVIMSINIDMASRHQIASLIIVSYLIGQLGIWTRIVTLFTMLVLMYLNGPAMVTDVKFNQSSTINTKNVSYCCGTKALPENSSKGLISWTILGKIENSTIS